MDEHSIKHKAVKTFENDNYMLNKHILPVFGRRRINDIKKREIEKFHSGYENNKSNANRILALISHIFTKATEWEYIELNPAQGIRRQRREKVPLSINRRDKKTSRCTGFLS